MLSTSSVVSLFLTWPFTATVPSTSSAHAIAPKSPLMPRSYNDSDLDVSLPSDTKKFYSNRLCIAEQRQLEQMDWADALRLATALASWRVNGPYQAAMDLYMGNDTRGRLGKIVEANIIGAAKVHTENTWPEKSNLFVMCEEPPELVEAMSGSNCEGTDNYAFEFGDTGRHFENHYIVFCPIFYGLPSLSDALREIRNSEQGQNDISSYHLNRGIIYFHESLHLADLTTPVNHPIVDYDPAVWRSPYIYGPKAVMREARQKNTGGCIHIADAYSFAAAAILAQQTFHLAAPPTLPLSNISTARIQRRPKRDLPFDRVIADRARDYFPNPDMPDNHVVMNSLGFGPAIADNKNAMRRKIPRRSTLQSKTSVIREE